MPHLSVFNRFLRLVNLLGLAVLTLVAVPLYAAETATDAPTAPAQQTIAAAVPAVEQTSSAIPPPHPVPVMQPGIMEKASGAVDALINEMLAGKKVLAIKGENTIVAPPQLISPVKVPGEFADYGQQLLTTALVRADSAQFDVIDPSIIKKSMAKLKFDEQTSLNDLDNWKLLGADLNLKYIVMSSITVLPSNPTIEVSINARIVEIATGKILSVGDASLSFQQSK